MKIKKWLLGLCLLFGLATLSVCSFSDGILIGKSQREIQDAAFSDKGRVEVPEDSYTIGTLGGRKVRMSSYQVQDVSYTDTPTAFSKDWETYKAPPRTYDSVLTGFDFYLNYETGVIRDIRHDDGFYDELRASGRPWVLVGVGNNLNPMDAPLPDKFDRLLATRLETTNPPYRRYVRLKGEDFYGLEQYRVLGINPKTGLSYRNDPNRDDIFISRGKDGRVLSYIACATNTDVPNPPCSHDVMFREKGLDIALGMLYSRHRLYDWRKIEEQAGKAVLAFAEAADKDIEADAHHKMTEGKK
ncbi:hypothetical protein [Neisseria sp. oral taxon 014]|uniref:hypothetical protein n=1 Tax=Neisseria sp. oral taxon 014 TaxID=641148 RepID=UPI0025CDA4E0|nr:hypothetical protein [Neisseria sp. oral taxon 014]